MWSELSSGWKLHIVVCCLYIVAMVVTLPIYLFIGPIFLIVFGMSVLVPSLILLVGAYLSKSPPAQKVGI